MSKLYDKKYLELSIKELNNLIDDMSKWSAYNYDQISEELYEINQITKKLKKKLEEV